ncbi:MAG TPA: hypothetical protein VG013_10635 [Gemmataceae bacterium]|jgi:hypothetical protein|nr:hypothetical protein [Gemmataceae bacterium]
MRVEIASPPDRDKLVAPIMFADQQWAEVNQEKERLQLEIYPRRDGQPWLFDFEEAVQALLEARRRLLGK